MNEKSIKPWDVSAAEISPWAQYCCGRGSNRCPDDRKRSRSAETTRGNYVLRKMPEYFGSACAEEVFRRF